MRAYGLQDYSLQEFQISGGPDWINTARFDIQARAEEKAVPSRSDQPDPTRPSTMQLMMRSLLEERFQLRSHSEMRELPVYVLSVGKDGLKLKAAIEGAPGLEGMSPGSTRTDGSNGKVQMVGTTVPMRTLVVLLSQQLQRPVIDKTNLKGTFDFALNWFGAANPAAVFTAGQESRPQPSPMDHRFLRRFRNNLA